MKHLLGVDRLSPENSVGFPYNYYFSNQILANLGNNFHGVY